MDVYRLNDENDFTDTGALELFNSKGICIIEWSERIEKSLPFDTIRIKLEITGLNSRKISIFGIKEI